MAERQRAEGRPPPARRPRSIPASRTRPGSMTTGWADTPSKHTLVRGLRRPRSLHCPCAWCLGVDGQKLSFKHLGDTPKMRNMQGVVGKSRRPGETGILP